MGRRSRAKRQRRRSSSFHQPHAVVGFVALHPHGGFCDGDALVVAASSEVLQRMLARAAPYAWQIQPARFAPIWQCLQLGAAYCFDEAAYRVFMPLAQQAGLPLGEQDFSDPGPTGAHFVRVQINPLG